MRKTSEGIEYTDESFGRVEVVKDFLPEADQLKFRTHGDTAMGTTKADAVDPDESKSNADQR